MNNNRSAKVWLWVILFGIFPALILGLAIFKRKSQSADYYVDQGAILRKWKNGKFQPVFESKNFRDRIGELKIEGGDTLSSKQAESLYNAVYNFFLAYSSGSYEAFKRFRMPVENGSFSKERLDLFRKNLQLIAQDPEQQARLRSKETGRQFRFDADSIVRLKADLNRVNTAPHGDLLEYVWNFWDAQNFRYCTRCWKDVDLSSARLQASQSESAPSLRQAIEAQDHIDILTINPIFEFDFSEEPPMPSSGYKFALLSCILKNSEDPPYPIYVRFRWSEQHEQWLPVQMGATYGKQRVYSALF